MEILKYIAAGNTDKEIAEIFFFKTITICKKNQYIRKKIGAKNRADMIRFAIKNKIA